MNDKKVIITREEEVVKITTIDLKEDGSLNSFGTICFAPQSEISDEQLFAYAKKMIAIEEADELEVVAVEDYINDPSYSYLVSTISEASKMADINDDPSTSANEAEGEVEA